MPEKLALWEPADQEIVPVKASTPTQITSYAIQLSAKDRQQIVHALENGLYEMGVNHLWIKSMSALKRELGTLGSDFLGEMLGRADIEVDDNPQDFLSDKDALRLAEELGVVSTMEGLRLRQTQELIIHLAQKDFQESDSSGEEMDEVEAIRALKACVKNILGKPKIEVAHRFVVFRRELLSSPLTEASPSVTLLVNSPYFFQKLSLSILLSAIKSSIGAALEVALGNLNSLLPLLWGKFRETEKLQVGRLYSEVYASGLSIATQGLKKALLKVEGFDFVPESLRSESFIKAAEEVLKAHDGFDNFYNELTPVRNLEKMGSVIPAHALAQCTTALLAVKLGNQYGTSHTASPIAGNLLDKYTPDRWAFYLNQCLPGDVRILQKLTYSKPRSKWMSAVENYSLAKVPLKNKTVNALIEASATGDDQALLKAQGRLVSEYYGKRSA